MQPPYGRVYPMTTPTAPPVATSTGIQRLGEAIATLADTMAHADGLGEHFTCREAEQLALVLALAGHPEAAAWFLEDHARGDGEGDMHAEGQGMATVGAILHLGVKL